ncbi:MAG: hypothetical protein KDA90_22790 [Planctomycetaceae bacterium]|nr:hypothetical protein [Planctomycetaceae bacterium]
MNRTDIFIVAYKKHADDLPILHANLVRIEERWIVVFEWLESYCEPRFVSPKLMREVPEDSLIQLEQPNGLHAHYFCQVPMSFGETLEFAPDIDAADPSELSPEWRFELPKGN